MHRAHVVLVIAIRLRVPTLSFLLMLILWVYLVLIAQVNLLFALFCFSFDHLLVLMLDGLLDFLGLHHDRPCVSEVSPFELLASTLGVALSQGQWWLVTKEVVVLWVDVKGGRRALLLVAVLCHIWLIHHALTTAHTHRTCFCCHLLLLGYPSLCH